MWFPKFFTRFLPGWIINIALVVHSDEALLAAGFIFTFHFFNTHFRIEKFPMDTVIFSGRISKTEMLHERRRWYDRLVADGRLDDYRVKDDWEGARRSRGFWLPLLRHRPRAARAHHLRHGLAPHTLSGVPARLRPSPATAPDAKITRPAPRIVVMPCM